MNTFTVLAAFAAIASGASTTQVIEPADVCKTDTSKVATIADLIAWEATYTAAQCKEQVVDTITLNKDKEVCVDSTKKILAINGDFSATQFQNIGIILKADKACGKTVISAYEKAWTDCDKLVMPDDKEQVLNTELQKKLTDAKNEWDMKSQPLPIIGGQSIYINVADCELEDDGHILALRITGSSAAESTTTAAADASDTTDGAADDATTAAADSSATTASTTDGIGSTIAAASIVSAAMAYISL